MVSIVATLFIPDYSRLGTDTDISITKVNTPKNKKDAPASGSENKGRKRARGKLIRLEDLIPEKDIQGGHQVLFGVTDTTKPSEKGK
jgi:hypothetical protein